MDTSLGPISIYALGGLCEVGKNTYCIESDDSLIVIDAGVMFPDENHPGVSFVIPDYQKIRSARQKLKALIITHGHEDHIGAIPFLVQNVHVPVIYAPKLAAALIKHKLQDHRIREEINIVEYDENSVLNIGEFTVSFFYVTHSIPDAYGVVVDTPHGRIVHTGDFKIDLSPVGKQFELAKLTRIGSEGVDLLLSDSTNAEIEGYTPSESNVLKSINDIFDVAHGRVIVSTFSSNISRIQQICQVAVEHNRKILILGRSMEFAVQVAREYGYIKVKDNAFIQPENLSELKKNEICILCTGSQGEDMAALSRIANGTHKDVTIYPGDTVVFSSSAIPGNGVFIDTVVNMLVRKGANVLKNSVLYAVHSSGHPSKQELRLMLRLVRPKYFMPIHGDYRMLKIHADLATTVGVAKENTFVMENGDSLLLSKHKITKGPHFPAEPVYIDGRDIGGLNEAVIKDREILQEDGLVAVVVAIDSNQSKLVIKPEIITRGFVANNAEMNTNIAEIVELSLNKKLAEKVTFADIKNEIRRSVANYVYFKSERKPLVIPVVMDMK